MNHFCPLGNIFNICYYFQKNLIRADWWCLCDTVPTWLHSWSKSSFKQKHGLVVLRCSLYVAGKPISWITRVWVFHEINNTIILDIIILVPCNNPPHYQEHVIYFISFYFGEGVTITDWIVNIKLYVSEIVKPYKDTIISYSNIFGTTYLFLYILQCWRACAIHSAQDQARNLVICCLYWVFPNQTQQEIKWYSQASIVIQYSFIKICIKVKCLGDGYVIYNIDIIIQKDEFIFFSPLYDPRTLSYEVKIYNKM